MEQLERITHYENILNRFLQTEKQLDEPLEEFAALLPLLRELEGYYGSEEWLGDLADDEAGKLPPELRRGVLSEDGVWDALDGHRRLIARMSEIVTIYLGQ